MLWWENYESVHPGPPYCDILEFRFRNRNFDDHLRTNVGMSRLLIQEITRRTVLRGLWILPNQFRPNRLTSLIIPESPRYHECLPSEPALQNQSVVLVVSFRKRWVDLDLMSLVELILTSNMIPFDEFSIYCWSESLGIAENHQPNSQSSDLDVRS